VSSLVFCTKSWAGVTFQGELAFLMIATGSRNHATSQAPPGKRTDQATQAIQHDDLWRRANRYSFIVAIRALQPTATSITSSWPATRRWPPAEDQAQDAHAQEGQVARRRGRYESNEIRLPADVEGPQVAERRIG